MKIEITEAFQKIVENAAHFSAAGGKVGPMSVYSCVEVTVQGGTATVIAANGHAFYTASAPGFGLIEGSFTVDAHLFSAALGRFSNGSVESTDNVLIFQKGRQKFSLATFTEMEMPEVPETPAAGALVLDGKMLLAALDTVAYAMNKDDTQPNMSTAAVRISSKGGKLRFDAVDGFRIGRCVVPVQEENVDILLPFWVVRQALTDELVKGAEKITAFSGGGHVGVCTDSVRIISNMLAGTPLDVDAVLQDYPNTICCDTAMLQEILKTSKLVQETAAANAKLPIVLEILPDKQKISVHLRTTTAALSDEIPLIGDKKAVTGLKIGLNAGYLNEAMQHVASADMLISYNQSLSPLTVRPHVEQDNGVEVVHLILPVRLQDGE